MSPPLLLPVRSKKGAAHKIVSTAVFDATMLLLAISSLSCQFRRVLYEPPVVKTPIPVTSLPIPEPKNRFAVLPRIDTDLSAPTPSKRRRRRDGEDVDDDSDTGSGDGSSSASEFLRSPKGLAIIGGSAAGLILIVVLILVFIFRRRCCNCSCCRCCRRGAGSTAADQYGQVILDDNDSIGLETI